ncbi:hypothetical protein V1498_10180 [Peribacillus sp. SCS-26]|uniref:hypothetical protein n=1 Tax=Paraperibacillus marinus TaxID=3115295 RepID=UPI003906B49B
MIDQLFEAVDFILDLFSLKKNQYAKNYALLRKEPWFQALLADYRYEYIIHNSSVVTQYLKQAENLKLLLHSEEERMAFIDLVKAEHLSYTGLDS